MKYYYNSNTKQLAFKSNKGFEEISKLVYTVLLKHLTK